jgi:hypothetical protein
MTIAKAVNKYIDFLCMEISSFEQAQMVLPAAFFMA